jgi:hypothetical protein
MVGTGSVCEWGLENRWQEKCGSLYSQIWLLTKLKGKKMKDPCISLANYLNPCLYFRILFQFLASEKIIEFRKKIVLFCNNAKFHTKKRESVHLSICAFVMGLKNIQKKATIVGVCIFLAKTLPFV